ncbi:G-protein coupled receptor [Plasmodium falciparum RAJ116]|uniref:G-protein coupled receptor n=1 Tax=Plasmodium falciparum RAJ116 TaxID=580058 RepID=A0A0L0CYK7_PLAFA|nr:G-protein coupled receptor [Plasmodium falciparum RAJ116]
MAVMNKLDEYVNLIYKVTDEILTLYTSDNLNVYSSIKIDNMSSRQNAKKKRKEILLQWCHGNIGYIILLMKLLKYDNVPTYFKTKYNEEYLNNMGLLIWEKGLLTKGLGLCHGISGNGIVLLYLYNYTQNKIWYSRAYKYALFCIKYFDKFCNIPDRPLSLFEANLFFSYNIIRMLQNICEAKEEHFANKKMIRDIRNIYKRGI